MRRVFASTMLVLAVAAVNGCGGSSEAAPTNESEARCNENSDCAPGKICKVPSTTQTQVVAPCPHKICTKTSECGAEQICAPITEVANLGSLGYLCLGAISICAPRCQTAGCKPGRACQTDGTCRELKCDEVGSLGCPDAFACDPAAAASEPLTVAGSLVPDDPSALARGCVRKRCNQAGGFTCRDRWTCEPTASTDGSGCVPIPCSVSGHCSDDSYYVCTPTSSASRSSEKDVHGCVARNCEEGRPCGHTVNGIAVGYCDYSGPLADTNGCAAKRCLESGGACPPAYRCEAVSAATDARGCRAPACWTTACPTGMRCSPTSATADADGCVPIGTGSGGAGGTSNTVIAKGGAGGANTTGSTSGGAGGGTGTLVINRGGSSNAVGGNTSTTTAISMGGSTSDVTRGIEGGALGLAGATTSQGDRSTVGGSTSTAALGICSDP